MVSRIKMATTCLYLYIHGINETVPIQIANIMAVPDLPSLLGSIPINEDINRYPHLQGLTFPYLPASKVELLIGSGVKAAHEITEQLKGNPDQVKVVHIGLSWALVGQNDVQQINHCSSVGFVYCKSEDLYLQVQRMFDWEFEDIQSDETGFSVNDRRALSTQR